MCCDIRNNQKAHLTQVNVYEDDLLLFKKLVSAVSNLPITAKVLTETKIGRGINSIVKDQLFSKDSVSNQALQLVN